MNATKFSIAKKEPPHITFAEPFAIHKTVKPHPPSDVLYLHWHPEIEFLLLEEGEFDFFVENDCYHMQRGDAIFIPPNLLHRAFTQSNKCIIFRALVFSPELIVSNSHSALFKKYVQPLLFSSNFHYILHLQSDGAWMTQIIQDLRRIFDQTDYMIANSPENDYSLLVEGMIQVIWQTLYHFYLSKLYTRYPITKTQEGVQQVISFINQHYQENLSLTELGKIACVSEAQLCRSFKHESGSTPFTYLKKYRIMKSCELLSNTNKKISEICTMCGFNNISYYNREFLKLMNVTPSEYRRNLSLVNTE